MTDRVVKVRLEGDAASLEAAMKRGSKASAETTSALERTSTAIAKNKDAVGKFGTAVKQAAPNIASLAAGMATSAKSATSLASAIGAGAKAFGPWGLAIGIAIDFTVGYIASSREATIRTREFWDEVRAGITFAKQSVKDAQNHAVFTERDAAAIARATGEHDARAIALENEIAKTEGLGKSTRDLERALAGVRSESLRAQADLDLYLESDEQRLQRRIQLLNQAAAIERAQELKDRRDDAAATLPGKTRRGRAPKKQPGFSMTPGAFIERDDSRDFAAGMRARPALTRGAADPTEAAANSMDAQLRAIEVQRATTGESIELINAERDARLDLLRVQQEATVIVGEREAIAAEMRQINHDAEIARIEQRKAAEESLMQKRIAWADVTAQIAAGGIATANMALAAAGVNAKKREKIAGRLAGVQAMLVGGSEAVLAAAALASFNYPQFALHTAASAFAFTQGALMLSGALPSGAGGGGGGAGSAAASSAEASTRTSNGPAPNTGPIPGSPGPQTPTTGGSGTPFQGGTVIHISGNFYGTPKREFVREIDEQLGQLGGHHRRRS